MSDANNVMPSSRCVTTMAGCSLSVTVHAPNAPCTHTSASTAVAYHGDCLRSFRLTHATTTSVMINTPTAIAK